MADTLTTLRPNGSPTGLGTGWTVTGAANEYAATSDNSDASYIASSTFGEQILDFSTATIPTGAVLKRFVLRIRCDLSTGGPSTITVDIKSGASSYNHDYFSVSTTKSTQTGTAFSNPIASQAQIDALQFHIIGVPNLRVYEVYLDVYYNQVSTVTIDTPAVGTTTPTVTWHPGDPEGDAQSQWQLRIFPNYVYTASNFDPATTGAEEQAGSPTGHGIISDRPSQSSLQIGLNDWTTAPPGSSGYYGGLTNGNTYKVYMRVADADHAGSAGPINTPWSTSAAWTVALTPPPDPVLTSSADATNGRIHLTLNQGGAGPPATDYFTLERSEDAGVTWTALERYSFFILNDTPGTAKDFYDYEVPANISVQYRARAYGTNSGNLLASGYDTETLTLVSTDWWLKDPLDPTRNIKITNNVMAPFRMTSDVDKGDYSAVGRKNYVTIVDVYKAEKGQLNLEFETRASYNAFDVLRKSLRTLLLQRNYTSDQWYVTLGNRTWDITIHNPPMWDVSVPITEVDVP